MRACSHACSPVQSAVYLAGGSSTFRNQHGVAQGEAAAAAAKHLHAPARRLARTVISLGQGEGRLFAMRALKAISAVSGAAEGDLHRWVWRRVGVGWSWAGWGQEQGRGGVAARIFRQQLRSRTAA